ncbi:hypothetical protein BY457_102139 [Marinilabilia salmonicolor]|uniref:hypothetical protein n=1 Tax=Marinilabilia salmonicolor TaxID=989 RepID=UPI000D402372|nr:hypothetical protein [Marinilabilia salmonicolor]PRZ01734.1 hypothetical protein BY457_102139 [Marinilabilia salmonicolor]
MQFHVKINEVKNTDQLEDAWSLADFKELMTRFEVPDAETVKDNEVKDFLFMAINEFEPRESAAIVLDYKLSDQLTEGQIDNISLEMLSEKMAEKYTEIDLHKPLFEVNQLLYKAYNGKFPHIQINVIDLELSTNEEGAEFNKEVVLKAFSQGLSDNNLLHRLFGDQLEGKVPFPEAEGIVWELKEKGDDHYEVITSEKWLTKEEVVKTEFDAVVVLYDENAAEA